jgi:CheY-like chemotaxis protein
VRLPRTRGDGPAAKLDPDLRPIPIVVVTSYALSGDEAKALAAGADAYVTKPFSPRVLLAFADSGEPKRLDHRRPQMLARHAVEQHAGATSVDLHAIVQRGEDAHAK